MNGQKAKEVRNYCQHTIGIMISTMNIIERFMFIFGYRTAILKETPKTKTFNTNVKKKFKKMINNWLRYFTWWEKIKFIISGQYLDSLYKSLGKLRNKSFYKTLTTKEF